MSYDIFTPSDWYDCDHDYKFQGHFQLDPTNDKWVCQRCGSIIPDTMMEHLQELKEEEEQNRVV